MAAYSADKKTLAYKLGEALSTMTDHYLLMPAPPHKGEAEAVRLQVRAHPLAIPWQILMADLARTSESGKLSLNAGSFWLMRLLSDLLDLQNVRGVDRIIRALSVCP